MNVGAIERACGLVRAVAASCRDACPRRDTVYCSSCDLHDARDIAAALDAARPAVEPGAWRTGPEPGRRLAPPREGSRIRLAYDWLAAHQGWHGPDEIMAAVRLADPDAAAVADHQLPVKLFERGYAERRDPEPGERARRGRRPFMYRVAAGAEPEDDGKGGTKDEL